MAAYAGVTDNGGFRGYWRVEPSRTFGSFHHVLSADNRYGTTIRCFDRKDGLWRIVWINPVSGAVNTLAGKRDGDRIFLEAVEDGQPIRRSFNHIRSDSFIWRGESRQKDGHWRLDAEFRLRRIA